MLKSFTQSGCLTLEGDVLYQGEAISFLSADPFSFGECQGDLVSCFGNANLKALQDILGSPGGCSVQEGVVDSCGPVLQRPADTVQNLDPTPPQEAQHTTLEGGRQRMNVIKLAMKPA